MLQFFGLIIKGGSVCLFYTILLKVSEFPGTPIIGLSGDSPMQPLLPSRIKFLNPFADSSTIIKWHEF